MGKLMSSRRLSGESKPNLGDELVVITDICMCEYTSHGHCGIVDFETKEVLNDPTLEVLGKIAVSHAKSRR